MTTTQHEWPDYATLDSSICPAWLAKSVAETVGKYGDRVEAIRVEFTSSYYYDDNDNYVKKAEAWITWHGDAPSQDELDHLPAMRRMERLSVDLWDHLPIEINGEGDIVGEVSYKMDHNGVVFMHESYDSGRVYHLTSQYIDGQWVTRAIIEVTLDQLIEDGVSDTTALTLDPQAILAEADPDYYNLKSWPEKCKITKNDDMITLSFDVDEFKALIK